MHRDDPLGGVLTTTQMKERDEIMFSTAKSCGIPIVWNLAGGYQRDENGSIKPVIDLHLNTFAIATEIFREKSDHDLLNSVASHAAQRQLFTISDWTNWDRTIDERSKDFRTRNRCWPNIMMASSGTLQRIDIAANNRAGKVARRNDEGLLEKRPEGEFVGICGFNGGDYNIDFCIDEALPQDKIILLWDGGPEGPDGLDYEDEGQDLATAVSG